MPTSPAVRFSCPGRPVAVAPAGACGGPRLNVDPGLAQTGEQLNPLEAWRDAEAHADCRRHRAASAEDEARRSGVPFRAVLVGGGNLLDRHRELAAAHLGDAAALPGSVPTPVAYPVGADVFVLPSLQEASGSLSLLEALQGGIAVVASAIDGIVEDVTHEESALLVPAGDGSALARALRHVLTDASLRRRLAGAGRAVFQQRFSADALIAGLCGLYAALGVAPHR